MKSLSALQHALSMHGFDVPLRYLQRASKERLRQAETWMLYEDSSIKHNSPPPTVPTWLRIFLSA